MPAAFDHAVFVLAVHDADASAAYFVDVLGFDPLLIDAPGWRFVEREAARIDLFQSPGVMPASDLGDHNWFARIFVDDLDDYYKELVRRGADIIASPEDKPWSVREMTVRTLDGHRIQFCEVLRTWPLPGEEGDVGV
jgi:catechol 2,3-dioxygenase-like lactoylglutathione lyase family enzyme